MLKSNNFAPIVLALAPIAQAAIEWGPCPTFPRPPGNLIYSCASLQVPLDYTNKSSNEKLSLDLIKLDAVVKPAKNSILINFGGPGGEGVGTGLATGGAQMLKVTGGASDLISWNPRGTNNTLTFSCFESNEERTAAASAHPVNLWNASSTAPGTGWAEASLFASKCNTSEQTSSVGEFVGTVFTARDIMQIVDALDQGPLLNYYGMSYGSVLGETVAAMFPDRMGNVIIDGVLNPLEWYHGYSVSQYDSTDDVFKGFMIGCVAKPENCALATNNTTYAELEAQMEEFFERLKYNPIPVPALGLVVDYSIVKANVAGTLDNPSTWATNAGILAGLMKGDTTAFVEMISKATQGPAGIDLESQYGIRCSDSNARASTLEGFEPVAKEFIDTSKWFGDVGATASARCAQWPFKAKETYQGDFRVKTHHPMLIIGNTYDPATSLASAKNATATFQDSVLLQHNGYGHLSWVQESACTLQHMHSYFINGTLPPLNTVCQPDAKLFTNALLA